jgi:hypothetical protein
MLPPELLVKIFLLLEFRQRLQLRIVCQSWDRLLKSHVFWTSLSVPSVALDSLLPIARPYLNDLTITSKIKEQRHFQALVKCARLKKLEMKVGHALFHLMKPILARLNHLALEPQQVREEEVIKMLDFATGLQSLRLINTSLNLPFRKCHQLIELDLCYIDPFPEKSFALIIKSCPLLQSIKLLDCKPLNPGILRHCVKEVPVKTIFLKQLEGHSEDIMNSICTFASKVKGIQHFALTHRPHMTQPMIQILMGYLTPMLETLDFSGCSQLSDDCLKLIHANNSIKRLFLADCWRISDKGVQRIGKKCPQLQELTLSGIISLTDNALETIGKYCPQMTLLNVSKCLEITHVGLSHLSELEFLQQLVLNGCSKLTRDALAAFKILQPRTTVQMKNP